MGVEQLVTATGGIWDMTGCRGIEGGRRKPRMVPRLLYG